MTSDERAALVERLATEIVDAEAEINDGNPVLLARRLVAWFEAAGWGPLPEPITEDEIDATERAFVRRVYWDEDSGRDMVMLMIHALPERHRRLVLGE